MGEALAYWSSGPSSILTRGEIFSTINGVPLPQPFIIIYTSSWYDWNTVKRGVKSQDIHPSIQKFTFSDNDYGSIHDKKKQDTKKIKKVGYSTPLNASKQKREKALVTDEAWLAETWKYGPCFFSWI